MPTYAPKDPRPAAEHSAVVAQMLDWRCTSRNALATLIDQAVVTDRTAFSLSIQYAASALGGISELARIFDAVPSTVGRWAAGRTLPAVHARKIILETLVKKLRTTTGP